MRSHICLDEGVSAGGRAKAASRLPLTESKRQSVRPLPSQDNTWTSQPIIEGTMSDRTFANIFAPFAPAWRPAGGMRGPVRPAVVDPYTSAGSRGVPGPDVAPRTGLQAMLRAAWRRHRSRACLADLDARALKDIGVSFAEAEAEANKPFWIV
jgi:uncharacterized protein YjiS (DUF1127 family)